MYIKLTNKYSNKVKLIDPSLLSLKEVLHVIYIHYKSGNFKVGVVFK